MTQSIYIINQKGGVGKPTSSINISAFLAIHTHKVLLIDLDPQGNSMDTLLSDTDLSQCKTTYDLFNDEIKKYSLSFENYIQVT